MKKWKKIRLLLGFMIGLGALSLYFHWRNTSIMTTEYTYEHPEIPDAFDDFTIVQVSDLHNTYFNGELTEAVKEEEPDMIVVTGDVIDRNRTDLQVAAEFLERMTGIAPVYFVSGNHEVASGEYENLQEELDRLGVYNLDDSLTYLEKDGQTVGMIGLADPLLVQEDEVYEEGTVDLVIASTLEDLDEETATDFTLLLAHRPERFDIYAENSVDLAFTGHAHGGQIRLPVIGGIFAPTQGFFPEYSEGIYKQNGTSMVVSRGLGNSVFPFRIFNRPELVVVTLKAE